MQRFGAVGKHGSIAVTQRAILTLKQEWLWRVPLIRGTRHLGTLLEDFADYYSGWRGHTTLGGAVPDTIYAGREWHRPDRLAKRVPARIERRFFPATRVTAFRLAKAAQMQRPAHPPTERPWVGLRPLLTDTAAPTAVHIPETSR